MRTGPSRVWILGRVLRSGLLRPRALFALAAAVLRSGANLVALLRFGAAGNPGAMLVDERERIGFGRLADDAERLAALLRREHGVSGGQAVAIVGGNSVMLVRCLFAVSRLGGRAILLNPHLPVEQIDLLLRRHDVDVVLTPRREENLPSWSGRIVCDPAILPNGSPAKPARLPRGGAGEIVVLTGGTTGLPKAARRPARPPGVLRLFLHLLAELRLEQRRSVHIAVPLFHGFGLVALVIAVALGRPIHLRARFDGAEAAALVGDEGVDTLVVVPTSLRRLLRSPAGLLPLRCVVTGGAPLPPALTGEVRDRLGEVLFNLYGTSEAGLSVIATPRDLAKAPATIGRPAWGVEVRITDGSGRPTASGDVGELLVRNRASIAPGSWIATGDRASRDAAGRLFLHGRTDDTIVSGGENVSPWEVEAVLLTHPQVAEAIAVGVPDAEYGQRLIAFAVPHAGAAVEAGELLAWLKPRVARHQLPRSLTVREALPLTAIGKVDRRALAGQGADDGRGGQAA